MRTRSLIYNLMGRPGRECVCASALNIYLYGSKWKHKTKDESCQESFVVLESERERERDLTVGFEQVCRADCTKSFPALLYVTLFNDVV